MESSVMNKTFRCILLFIFFSLGASNPDDTIPPMYYVHDAATEVMHTRMTLTNGEPCNTRFGSRLEEIMAEMETNKEADEALANKLADQFKEIMEQDSEMKLCVPDSWCDLGTCKPRIEFQEEEAKPKSRGRSFGARNRARSINSAVVETTTAEDPTPTSAKSTNKSTDTDTTAVTGGPTNKTTTVGRNDGHDHEPSGDADDGASVSVKSSFTLLIVIVLSIVFIL